MPGRLGFHPQEDNMLTEAKARSRRILLPIVRWLHAAGVQPDQLTVAGVIAAGIAGLALALGNPGLGLVWLMISLLCDLLDGDLARLRSSGHSVFGAFIDSCSDRASEAFVFGGLLIGKAIHGGGIGWLWGMLWVLTLAGGFLVSYTRARAEGLGLSCTVGIGERAARMVILILLLLFGFRSSGWFLLALVLLSWFTVYQRVAHVRRETRGTPGPVTEGPSEEGV
jgi:CDP-diacylglycerol--glycerol-3-phosphate 3-phosphatidyltransferase